MVFRICLEPLSPRGAGPSEPCQVVVRLDVGRFAIATLALRAFRCLGAARRYGRNRTDAGSNAFAGGPEELTATKLFFSFFCHVAFLLFTACLRANGHEVHDFRSLEAHPATTRQALATMANPSSSMVMKMVPMCPIGRYTRADFAASRSAKNFCAQGLRWALKKRSC